MSLCYRCEHRVNFLENKIASRCECGTIESSVCGCYMYEPVKPVVLKKNEDDTRPQFAGYS